MTFIFNALQDMVMGHRQDQKPGGSKVRTTTDGRTQPTIRYNTNHRVLCHAKYDGPLVPGRVVLFSFFRNVFSCFHGAFHFPGGSGIIHQKLSLLEGKGVVAGGGLQHLNHSLHVQYHAQKISVIYKFYTQNISVTHSQLSSASIWL